MQIRKRLANNLRRLRKTKNLTQNNLALKSGINVTTIGYIEQEYVSTSVDTLEILAGALGSDPSLLLASESINLNIGEYALCLNTKKGLKFFTIRNKLEFRVICHK